MVVDVAPAPVRRRGAQRRRLSGAVALGIVLASVAVVLWIMAIRPGAAAGVLLPVQRGAIPWATNEPLTMLISVQSAGSRPADSVVLSLRPGDHRLTGVLLPGNLWLDKPGYPSGTLASAYTEGGPPLALRAVEDTLHVPIPYYLTMSDRDFLGLVNDVGGITPAGHRARSLQGKALDAWWRHVQSLPAPEQRLRAFTVLLQAARRGLSSSEVRSLPTLIGVVQSSLHTNLPLRELPAALQDVSATAVTHWDLRVMSSAGGAVTPYTLHGRQMLLPDAANTQSLGLQLFGRRWPRRIARVTILNSTGMPGQAGDLALWLKAGAIPVASVGTGRSTQVTTQIQVPAHQSEADSTLTTALASLLQAPVVRSNLPAKRILVILGPDYHAPSAG